MRREAKKVVLSDSDVLFGKLIAHGQGTQHDRPWRQLQPSLQLHASAVHPPPHRQASPQEQEQGVVYLAEKLVAMGVCMSRRNFRLQCVATRA